MNSWSKNLELLIKSRASLIWIKTKEEERLENKLNIICERLNIKRFVYWDYVRGIKGVLNEEGKFSNNPLGILNWLKEQTHDLSTILLLIIELFSNLSDVFLVLFIFISNLVSLILFIGIFNRIVRIASRKTRMINYK